MATVFEKGRYNKQVLSAKWHLGAHPSLETQIKRGLIFYGFLSGGIITSPEELTIAKIEQDSKTQSNGYRTIIRK